MTQLIVFAAVVVILVILAIQNMTPLISLVLLGSTTITLPLALWLLVAIATGSILTMVIYRLAGSASSRSYRPLGQRVSMEPPSAERVSLRTDSYADSRPRGRSEPRTSQSSAKPRSSQPFVAPSETPRAPKPPQNAQGGETTQSTPASASKNAYDTDWESFKAPQQWNDWGERPDPKTVASEKSSQASQKTGFFGLKRPPYSADASVSDIESGWEDYRETVPPVRGGSAVDDNLDEIVEGWDDEYGGDPRNDYRRESRSRTQGPSREGYSGDDSSYDRQDYRENRYDEPPSRPPRNDFSDDSVSDSIFDSDDDDLGPAQVGPDGVYEADYRVIIPPYQPLKDEDEEKGSSSSE